MRRWTLAALVSAILVPAGCRVSGPREHIVMLDKRGQAVEPETAHVFGWPLSFEIIPRAAPNRSEAPSEDDETWNEYLDHMFAEIEQHGQESERKEIVIFIHGGLNTGPGAVERAKELSRDISCSGRYPVFINWNSSLASCYRDHLLLVRQGEEWDGFGWVFAPVYLAGDLSFAIVRSPFVFATNVGRFLRGLPYDTPLQEAADATENALVSHEEHGVNDGHDIGPPMAASFGGDERTLSERALRITAWFATLPAKVLTTPLIDTTGSSSWEIMLRRVHLLFHTEDDLMDGHLHQPTALLQFLQRLAAFQERMCQEGEDWEIVLIGHSMGTIVVNEILRHEVPAILEDEGEDAGADEQAEPCHGDAGPTAAAREAAFRKAPAQGDARHEATASAPADPVPRGSTPEGEGPHDDEHDQERPESRRDRGEIGTYAAIPRFDRIVYLGAACSLRDYEDSVFPYLRRHEATRMHHVTLHDHAEELEIFQSYVDIPPRGSLLVWIDDFLARPETPMDRTAGRYTNLLVALHHVLNSVRDRVTVKSFGVGWPLWEESPQSHGDFTQFPFWEPAFYCPEPLPEGPSPDDEGPPPKATRLE